MDSYRDHKIALPIRAASGSVNKEIEKQNLMLLLNNTRAHYQMVAQLLQQASNPMAPPDMKNYLQQVILASGMLMTKICKDFGIQDPTSVLPEPIGIREQLDQQQKQMDMAKMQQQLQLGGQAGPQPGGQPVMPQPQAPGAPAQGDDRPLM
jgi:hypothetical protein